MKPYTVSLCLNCRICTCFEGHDLPLVLFKLTCIPCRRQKSRRGCSKMPGWTQSSRLCRFQPGSRLRKQRQHRLSRYPQPHDGIGDPNAMLLALHAFALLTAGLKGPWSSQQHLHGKLVAAVLRGQVLQAS